MPNIPTSTLAEGRCREGMRPGERAIPLPPSGDVPVFFIGRIRTPWATREACPKRGSLDGPICRVEVDPLWQEGLQGIEQHSRLQLLYWMNLARRDLILQSPRHRGPSGTFSLRSPARPNPIASSMVMLVAVKGSVLEVRGLDCIDGTPLVDIKPEHCPHDDAEAPPENGSTERAP